MTGWNDFTTDRDPFDPLAARVTVNRVKPIYDQEINHTYHRSLAQQQREISALCLSVARLETQLEEAHQVMARQAATIARLRRQGPRSWEWALAGLVCALERAKAGMDRWYSFERRGR